MRAEQPTIPAPSAGLVVGVEGRADSDASVDFDDIDAFVEPLAG